MPYSSDFPPGAPDPQPCQSLAAWAAEGMAVPRYPGPVLRLDCSALPHPRSLGVCHQVSQLLLLHHTGFSISLYWANPVFCRCLQLLRVAHLFTWVA